MKPIIPNVEPPEQTAKLTIEQTLQQAVAQHQAGQLQEAGELYLAILQTHPNHPEANYNMGILAVQMKQPAAGLPYFMAALDADPARGQYWLSYIDALFQAGQMEDARQILALARQQGLEGDEVEALALRLKVGARIAEQPNSESQHAFKKSLPVSSSVPQNSQKNLKTKHTKPNKSAKKSASHHGKTPSPQEINALVALFSKGLFTEAAPLAQAMTERFPMHEVGWKALGAVFQQMGRSADALAPMQKAAALSPGDAAAHYNLGVTLQGLDRLDEAEASYRRALQIKPDYAEALSNLGVSLHKLGRLDEAEVNFRRALQIKPDYAEAYSNLGLTLHDLGRLDEAEASLRRALQIKPDYADALNNLGIALQNLGRLTEAEVCYRRALQIKPDYAEVLNNLGVTLQDLSRLDEAESIYRRALEVMPDYEKAFSNLLFVLNYHPDKSGEEIFEVYQAYDTKFGLTYQNEWHPHCNNLEANRRLKVGYVSSDFMKHSVRHFLEPLLAHHDKHAVEVYAYADLTREDSVTACYKKYMDQWIPICGMSDKELTKRIRADGIDILVDLAGHTKNNRLGVFARKPAPVSLSWLGYGYSTGLTAIDYLLTDETSAPQDSEYLFSEKPWRLATPGYVYRPAEDMGEVNPLPALGAGHVTFGSLTRGIRINHRVIRVWSEILKRVRGARLVIDSKDFREVYTQDILAEKFAAHGISRDQLQIGCHSPPWDVLRGLDIGLDCFPHNSGTTLFETLYMGIPYITLAGRPSVGRLGSTILEGHGHPEWIAKTEDEYIEKAIALAGNLPKLAILRAGLRQEMQAGPLMNEPVFARKVEAAYREMFEKWARSMRREKNMSMSNVLTAEQTLQQAVAQHQAGQLQEAGELYRAILQSHPDHPEANHNLGVLAVQTKQPAAGLPYFMAALNADPARGQYWLSYIDALFQADQLENAREMLALAQQQGLQGDDVNALAVRLDGGTQVAEQPNAESRHTLEKSLPVSQTMSQISQKKPNTKPAKQDNPAKKSAPRQGQNPSPQEINTLVSLFSKGLFTEAAPLAQAMTERFPLHEFGWKALGAVFQQMGRSADALAPLQKAAALSPGDAEAHINLGNTLCDLGRPDEGEVSLRRALEINADSAEAHSNLGATLQDLGRPNEAEASYRRALQIKPDLADAHYNLGNTLKDIGRLAEAEASYRSALQIKPDYAEAHNNRGVILHDLNRLNEAEASYRRALEIKPDYAEAHNNLGKTLKELGWPDKAETSYRRALEIKPDLAEAHSNLSLTLMDIGRLVEAKACCKRALEIAPEYAPAHQNLATILAYLSDFDQVVTESDTALLLKPDATIAWEQRLYTFSYHPDLTAEQIYAEFVRWGDRFPDPVVDFSAHDHTPGRRLRIGYVSPDFRRHSTRFFFWPLFANHDHAAVELFAYSNVGIEDDVTRQFKGLFDQWRNIRGVTDNEVARMIREDGIDILVDGSSHTRNDRLGVFTLKPAPIQATWLGTAWTTGLKMIDYVLLDPYMAPEGTLTRETIVRLPHCFVAYRPPEETATITPPPCLKNGYITFGYSGRTERLNHHTFWVWGEILRQNPTARLILDFAPFADPPTQEHYRQFMAKHGMDPGQVIMRKSANIFAGLNDIDIMLDSFPHSGGTTLFDGLWMGVPILTLAGRPPVGRIGTTLMINLGLPEWVAESQDEYIAKASALTRNVQALAQLRAGMRERMQNSPLMDGPGFARGVEAAYRDMFEKWARR